MRSFCPEGRGDIGSWLFGELNLRPSGCGTAATRGQRACCEVTSVRQDRAQHTNNGCFQRNTATSSTNTQLLWSAVLTAILKHQRFMGIRRKSGHQDLQRGRSLCGLVSAAAVSCLKACLRFGTEMNRSSFDVSERCSTATTLYSPSSHR